MGEMAYIRTPNATYWTPVGPGRKLLPGFHWVDQTGRTVQNHRGCVYQLDGELFQLTFLGWFPVMDEAEWKLGRTERIKRLLAGAVEIEKTTTTDAEAESEQKPKAKRKAKATAAEPVPTLF